MDSVIVIFFVFSLCYVVSSFPENLIPISSQQDVPVRVFTGDDVIDAKHLRNVQIMKRMNIGGVARIAIASRENLYLMKPSRFSSEANSKKVDYDEVVTWISMSKTRDLCMMKGQPKELCYNFLSVLEMTNENELLLCGTNSFTPMCLKYEVSVNNNEIELNRDGHTISGKQRSPFGPNQPSASIFTGGSLYSATSQSFFGGSPVLSRTMGEKPPLRTTAGVNTMNEPSFVKMAEDDERVLVYFNEIRLLSSGEKRTIAQVAQVCKNDTGGDRVLQRMWTTYIKSRLNCSFNGFYLDEIRDVTDPIVINGQSVVFASFSTTENSLAGSAVCSFTLDAIHSAMTGPFHIPSDVTSSVATVGSIPPVTSRHPGSCPDEKSTDSELLFIKSHPQMQKQVKGSLLLTNQGSRWSAIAVDVNAGPNNVTMLFIGTENGQLVRALAPATGWKHGAIVSIQDIFQEERCSSQVPMNEDRKVLSILIEEDSIVVAFQHCVISVPLRSCEVHRCKITCIGSADPYCGWDGSNCVPYIRFDPIMEQDLELGIATNQSCPESPPTVVVAEEEKEESTPKPPVIPAPQPTNRKDLGIVITEVEEPEAATLYPYKALINVGIVTFVATIVLLAALIVTIRYCFFKRAQQGEEAFKKQQMEEHRLALDGDEKRGSLSRKARQTYRGWKYLLCRAITPVPTPQVPLKSTGPPPRPRRENNYTEAPTLQQRHMEHARRSSSRLNSTSSTSSRQDFVAYLPVTQPLLTPNGDHYPELTLPKHVADAATIRLTTKPTGDFSTPSASPASSGSSPFYHDGVNGAVETGILPTASAKLRRRNERAANQTNEIMRDSDTAIRDLENALQQMEEHGFGSAPQPLPVHVTRQRLDSNDSGKGESPRNSLRTDLEQPVSVYTSRPQRPTSLNIQRSASGRRQRLLSEGSHPQDVSAPVMLMQRHSPDRMATGHHASRSQPTTPVSGHQKLSLFQPYNNNNNNQTEVSIYATLPKNNCPTGVTGRRRQRQQQQQGHFHVQPHQAKLYHQINMQRQASEPQRRAVVSYGAPPKGAPNFYPSMQVRGVHAQKVPYQQQQHWTNNAPQNHYPSLPHRSSSAPYGNNNNNTYLSENGFERPATLHRREKLPSLMRQTSMPGSTRPGVFVPPPTIPNSGVA